MPSQSETAEMRDARLEKLALERDQAVALLRWWLDAFSPATALDNKVPVSSTRKFLESLT